MSAAEVASGVRSAEDVIFCCLAPLAPKLAQGSGGRTAVIARCVESHLLIHSPSWGLETLDSAVGDGSRCNFQCRRERFSYPRRDFLLFRRDPYETQARLRSSGARLLSANAVALPSTFFQFLLLLPSALALLPFQVQPSQARLQMRIRHGRSKYSVLLPTRTTPVGGHVRVGATTNPPPLSSSVLIWCNSRHGRYVPKKQCTLNWSGA